RERLRNIERICFLLRKVSVVLHVGGWRITEWWVGSSIKEAGETQCLPPCCLPEKANGSLGGGGGS
ncbi:Hypothetical predicted protein, partial [Marmota monax]